MVDGAGDAAEDIDPRWSLGRLIAPETPEQFFRDFWERRHLHVAARQPERFSHLLSLDDVDHFLTSSPLRGEDLQLTNAARELSPGDYIHDNGLVDVVRIYQELAEGSTVILPRLHQRLARLASLCRSLEAELSAPVQTNVYLTPGGAQGFRSHYDSHDLFVLQVAGRKKWRLYQTPIILPLRGQRFRPGAFEPGAETASFILEAGDVIYIPRGVMHDASSDDTVSLHITVGILARSWHDLLVEALSALTLEDAEFRRGLPPGFARPGFDREEARQRFAALLRKLSAEAKFDAALDRFADELLSTRNPLLPGQLAAVTSLPRLTQASTIAPRPDLILRLEQTAEGLDIHCYGNVISLPAHAAAATTAALRGEAATVGELPGPLDAEGRLVLVRRLVREGLITAR